MTLACWRTAPREIGVDAAFVLVPGCIQVASQLHRIETDRQHEIVRDLDIARSNPLFSQAVSRTGS